MIEVDVRFVASSNIDLAQAVRTGRFREDLFHRLNVVPLRLPPLRSRREDIVPLAESFLARERERGSTEASGFATETADLLRGYLWPGNVRELRALVERIALMTPSGEITPAALPANVFEQPATLWAGRKRRPTLKDVELAYIRYVLEAEKGNQTRAAGSAGHLSQGSLGEEAPVWNWVAPAHYRASQQKVRASSPGLREGQLMDKRKITVFRERLKVKKEEILEAFTKNKNYGKEANGEQFTGHRRPGGRLLHERVPVQPVQLRAEASRAGGRSAVAHSGLGATECVRRVRFR